MPSFGIIVIVLELRLSKKVHCLVQQTVTCPIIHLDLLEVHETDSFILLDPQKVVLLELPINLYQLKDHSGSELLCIASYF